MRSNWLLVSTLAAGCAASPGAVGFDPSEGGSAGKADGTLASVPDIRCSGTPDTGDANGFEHFKNEIISRAGDPRHRGFDLVTNASAATQTLEGSISYTFADKALEDEFVDVFACRAGTWKQVGAATTDGEGHFAVDLVAADRLPIGMRDLYVSVVGDRSGVGFIGYVAPDDSPLIVSDVDGTLTSSENAFLETIVLGREPGARDGAARAYDAVTNKGYQLVYVTARGSQYTEATRRWLDHKSFPRGPVRLSPSFVTLPGGDTIAYKTTTITALADKLPIVAGVGNRKSDVTAYASSGVAANRIFVEMPDYASEVQPDLDAGRAIGFTTYDDLRTNHLVNF